MSSKAALCDEPPIARRRSDFLNAQRRHQVAKPCLRRPRVGVDESKDLTLWISRSDRRAQVVNFLPAVGRLPCDYGPNQWAGRFLECPTLFRNDRECGIVGAIADNNYFERRVILRKDSREVFSQPVVRAATRYENRNEWRELGVFLRQFASQAPPESLATAQRNQKIGRAH